MNRPEAVLVLVVLVLAVWGLMLLGWRRRAGRDQDLPAPQPLPQAGRGPQPGPGPQAGWPGIYVSTTRGGEQLERVVAHGLGARSQVQVGVDADGVLLRRVGAPSFRIPRADLLGVGRAAGMAGKVVGRDGLVVLSWRLGDRVLDTGIRLRFARDVPALVGGVEALLRKVA